MSKKIFLVLVLFFAAHYIYAQENNVSEDSLKINSDTLSMSETDDSDTSKFVLFVKKVLDGNLNWNFLITPMVNFQPETSWGFGIAGAYYIKPQQRGRIGSIGFNASYTINNQLNSNALATLYFGKKQKWFLYFNVGFKHFPDKFYGIGNKPENLIAKPFLYNSDNFYMTVQPQTFVKGNWIVGGSLSFRWENATAGDNNILGDSIANALNINGFKPYIMFGLGGVAAYDSRNNAFYPNKGLFFKTVITEYLPISKRLNSQLVKAQIDFRQYFTIYKDFIFAYQFITEWNFAKEAPFQMLPTIGGLELLRGVRAKKWNDDAMIALQGELRIPIWSIFKAAVFAGVGDVYNLKNWQWTTPKIGYGIGLRVKFNKSNANLRLDIARNNYDKNFKDFSTYNFYITVNEAF
ncbi:MAG: hypothetical protein LBN95_08175 [Prevotellaceae bacterium]|nr:hypothetical protein [Prevotellaceae bacterium]